jgi:pyruvate formate lyase activating enzyme
VILLKHEAKFTEKQGCKVKCYLCPHNCAIGSGQFGICSVRTNNDGVLQTTNYGEITAMAMDPIEKKPLYHFKPSKTILSVGSFGCNFSCGFCQNYSIAHYKSRSEYLSPDSLIEICLEQKDNAGIAFTYNEPTIWYEYVYDTSVRLKERYPDLCIVLITNGYIEQEPLKRLLPYIDAMNIDLKSFSRDYYKTICGGDLSPVLKTIEESLRVCHIEITSLLVNGLNDSPDDVDMIASWLGRLDKNIPLHLSRYYPSYKMDRPPTDYDVMVRARDIGKRHLNHVYLGNIRNEDSSTYCLQCGKLLIERKGFSTRVFVDKPLCPKCGKDVEIIF